MTHSLIKAQIASHFACGDILDLEGKAPIVYQKHGHLAAPLIEAGRDALDEAKLKVSYEYDNLEDADVFAHLENRIHLYTLALDQYSQHIKNGILALIEANALPSDVAKWDLDLIADVAAGKSSIEDQPRVYKYTAVQVWECNCQSYHIESETPLTSAVRKDQLIVCDALGIEVDFDNDEELRLFPVHGNETVVV